MNTVSFVISANSPILLACMGSFSGQVVSPVGWVGSVDSSLYGLQSNQTITGAAPVLLQPLGETVTASNSVHLHYFFENCGPFRVVPVHIDGTRKFSSSALTIPQNDPFVITAHSIRDGPYTGRNENSNSSTQGQMAKDRLSLIGAQGFFTGTPATGVRGSFDVNDTYSALTTWFSSLVHAQLDGSTAGPELSERYPHTSQPEPTHIVTGNNI